MSPPINKTGRLRSRPRLSAKAQSMVESQARQSPERSYFLSVVEPHDSLMADTGRSSKRQRLNGDLPDDSTIAVGSYDTPKLTTPGKEASPVTKASSSSVEKAPGRKKKRPRTSSTTKRASALNLHNYPSDHHPIGIAIWILQKIDQSRRGRSESPFSSSHSEGSPEPSVKHSPTTINTSGAKGNSSVQEGKFNDQYPSTTSNPTPTSASPAFEQENSVQSEESLTRLRAQRDRKSKQRLENWAKNKENDVVARAKLEAKKKYGPQQDSDPTREAEKQDYIKKRTKDDYGRLLRRQTAGFASDISQIFAFKPGFDIEVFGRDWQVHLDSDTVTAGKLLTSVLSSLTEIEVSAASQNAAVELVGALETRQPPTDSFFAAIRILAGNESILLGIDRVLRQLFGQKLGSAPAAESKLSQTIPKPSFLQSYLDKKAETQPSPLLTGSQSILRPSLPESDEKTEEVRAASSVDSMQQRPAVMNQGQARSSGRERKPTAKALATGREGLFRRSLTFEKTYPDFTSSQAVTTPKIPSKLKISHTVLQSQDTASDSDHSIVPVSTSTDLSNASWRPAGGDKAANKQNGDEIASKDTSSRPPSRGALIQHALPQQAALSLKVVNNGYTADPQLIKNLLFMAEMVASMPDSDDEDDEDDEQEIPLRDQVAQERLSLAAATAPNDVVLDSKQAGSPGSASPQTQKRQRMIEDMKHKNGGHADTMTPNKSPAPQLAAPLVRKSIPANAGQPASASHQSLLQGKALLVAQATGLTYPEIPRPYIDRDGWKMTGTVTDHGDELVEISPQEWTVHSSENMLRSNTLMPSLRRIKSVAQVAEDRVFRYPPRMGSQNKPADRKRKLQDEEIREENVEYEIAMYRIREVARERGLGFNRSMTWEQLHAAIKLHDAGHAAKSSPRPNHDQEMRKPPFASSTSRPSPAPSISDLHSQSNNDASQSSSGINASKATVSRLRSESATAQSLSPISRHSMSPPSNTANRRSSKGPALGLLLQSPIPGQSRQPSPPFNMNGFTNSHSPILPPPAKKLRLLPPKQRQQTSSSSPSPRLPSPNSTIANNANALNGGFPGGGIIINAQEKMDAKLRAKNKGPDFKMNISGGGRRHTPIAQAQPVRGGQIIKFEIL